MKKLYGLNSDEDDIEDDDDPCDIEQEVVCANIMGADHFHVQ